MLTISERFTSVCSPVIGVQNPTCGSVTRASIAHLTPTDLNNIFSPGGLFADLDAWFKTQIEMQACGVRRYAWYDWIYANADRSDYRAAISSMKMVKGPGLLYPFVMGKQETITNKDYWFVLNGCAVADYTVNTLDGAKSQTGGASGLSGPLLATTGGTRVVRVDNRHGIPMDPAWFRQREVIHIFNRRANGVALQGNWRIVSAACDTALTYCDVLLATENAGSSTAFDAAPVNGLIVVGINNVNDFESWCRNLPTIDPRKRVPFWWQTWRNSRCVDDEYRTVYNRLMAANPAFKEFGDLPLAEVNKQDEMTARRRFVNAFLFQKPISANQTLTLWENLETINTVAGSVLDTGMSGKAIGKRANFIGVKEQLRTCDQVFDLQGNTLNLIEFLESICYPLVRSRQSSDRKVTDLDFWTNDTFRAHFQTAAFAYYKAQYGEMLNMNVELGKMSEQLGIVYDSYKFKFPAGVRINIISDEFFNDYYDEMYANSMGDLGNLLLCLDIGKSPNGSIYYAQIAANRKSYRSADLATLARLDQTYQCVMEHLGKDQTLTSEAGTVVVECPRHSAWIENFAMAAPITTGRSGSTAPEYRNIY